VRLFAGRNFKMSTVFLYEALKWTIRAIKRTLSKIVDFVVDKNSQPMKSLEKNSLN